MGGTGFCPTNDCFTYINLAHFRKLEQLTNDSSILNINRAPVLFISSLIGIELEKNKHMEKRDTNKRTDFYVFETERDLIRFFSQFIPEKEIKNTLREQKRIFVNRTGESKRENRIDFYKKCEFALSRLIKESRESNSELQF